jgi:thioredoxin 1
MRLLFAFVAGALLLAQMLSPAREATRFFARALPPLSPNARISRMTPEFDKAHLPVPGTALLLALLGGGTVAALTTTGSETVEMITSRDDFYEKLASSREGKKTGHPDGDLLCIKFYAAWCKSCKAIAPKYTALAEKYNDQVHFFEMQFATTKEMKELFSELKVKKTPCVQFYRGDKGRLATIVCGPRHWTDVGKNLDMYLHEDMDEPLECVLNEDLTECTDVSAL